MLDFDGETKMRGFATTRWVRAANPSSAERAAVELVKKDASLIKMVLNPSDKEPTPRIFLEEISEVSWLAYLRFKPGKGYTFFIDEEEPING